MPTEQLEPYLSRLPDERHRDIAEELFAWTTSACSPQRDHTWHAENMFLSAIFAVSCAPPDATRWELRTSGKYVAFFWYLDNGPRHELVELASQLHGGQPTTAGSLGALYRAFIIDMQSANLDTRHVEQAIGEAVAAMAREPHCNPAEMSWEEFRTHRYKNIGTYPHLACWRAIRRLEYPDTPSEAGFMDQAVESTYLSNDLASFFKEAHNAESGAVTSNFVLFYTWLWGDQDNAIAAAITRYNEIINGLQQSRNRLAPLLGHIIDGVLDGQRFLTSFRYPNGDEPMQQLRHYADHSQDR